MSIQSLMMIFHFSVARSMRYSLNELLDETKSRLGLRLYKGRLFGQPKHIIEPMPGQGHLANFTVDNRHHHDAQKQWLRGHS